MRSRSAAATLGVLTVALAALALASMASRGLFGVAMNGTISRIEVRHEKHPPIDDVHLVHIHGDTTHVDRALALILERGDRVGKGRFDRTLEIGDREIELRASTDLRRAMIVIPLTVLLTATLLALRR
jgi:hypothetical protein